MPLEFETTDELLNFVSDGGVPRAHAQGYEWFWTVLTPALNVAAPATQEEMDRLVDCHYVAGDVHDFNNAPLAAIEEYKKALSYDPDHAASYREIACMQERVGDLENALANIEKALELHPDEKCAVTDRECILDSISDNQFCPRYKDGDICWQAYEALAKADPETALSFLAEPKDVDERRARLCALGALEKHDAYVSGWRKLLGEVSEIEFEQYDWFFIPEAVYEAPVIWKLFLDSGVRFGGVFSDFETLHGNEDYKSLSYDARIRLRMEYYLYDQSGDRAALKKLHNKYPEWSELAESLNA
ncbi:tetratricopeptide repeat protein [Marinicaulis aureus]|uniref:Tetratricopeptide repeat protein n=1 Tax=Hyphococcus aureus TaxID=2666033 RepID=A0ABW1KV20_9PROT